MVPSVQGDTSLSTCKKALSLGGTRLSTNMHTWLLQPATRPQHTGQSGSMRVLRKLCVLHEG